MWLLKVLPSSLQPSRLLNNPAAWFKVQGSRFKGTTMLDGTTDELP
jgi:hypothetical protein